MGEEGGAGGNFGLVRALEDQLEDQAVERYDVLELLDAGLEIHKAGSQVEREAHG